MTETIVRQVASVRDRPPLDMDPPLYEAIDPDALEAIVRSSGQPSLRVAFTYQGCRVSVDGRGRIDVEPRDVPPATTGQDDATN